MASASISGQNPPTVRSGNRYRVLRCPMFCLDMGAYLEDTTLARYYDYRHDYI